MQPDTEKPVQEPTPRCLFCGDPYPVNVCKRCYDAGHREVTHETTARVAAGMLGILALPLVETFGRSHPRDLPPPKKRTNPKREAQAAQRKARAINRRVGK